MLYPVESEIYVFKNYKFLLIVANNLEIHGSLKLVAFYHFFGTCIGDKVQVP